MSNEEKKNVDVQGLSSTMRNYLIFTGAFLVAFYLVFSWIGLKEVAQQAILVLVRGTAPFLIVHAKKYNWNKDSGVKSGFALAFIVVVAAGVVGLLFYGQKSPQIGINGRLLSISGRFGGSWEVRSVELIDSIPTIQMKTNGFNFGETLKGEFRLESWGVCQLFIEAKSGPFILVTTFQGEKIIIIQETCTTALARQLARGI